MSVRTCQPLFGATYPVRRELAALGGTWNSDERCWYIPEERYAEAEELVRNALKDSGPRRRGFGR